MKRYGFIYGDGQVRIIKPGEDPMTVYKGLVLIGYDPKPVSVEYM